jgi:acyl dehydratase
VAAKSEPSVGRAAVDVGSELGPLRLQPVSRTTLALFAGASGDHNSIHIDLDFARAAGMGDVFAHGMLSMGYLARLLTDWVPQDRIRSFSGRFTSRTPVGGQPTCTGRVEEISTIDGERRARLVLRVTLEDGTTTIVGTAVVALP